MPHSLRAVLFLLVWAAVCSSLQAQDVAPEQTKRPNIVIILVDDMGFSDLGCYGSEIETPNIDKLAAGGLRFTQFYNYGRCCPTRAALMTGCHPHQVGIGHMTEPPNEPLGIEGPYQGYLNDQCTTLAEVLRTAGYHTLMTGKWHLGINRRENWPLQRGFDHFYGGLSGGFNYFKPDAIRGMTRDNEQVTTDENFYTTETFTDEACALISAARQADDRPFFLYLAYNAPHWPLNPRPDDFQKYRGKYTAGWEALMTSRLAKQHELGLFGAEVPAAPHVGPQWNSLTDKQRDDLDAIMAAYAGCIDAVDQNVGKLVQHLQDLGELDNTLILFLSDNGACQEGGRLGQGSADMIEHPLLETTDGPRLGLAWANACNVPFRKYKHFVHEGGMCTPLIAHWPHGMKSELRGKLTTQVAWLPDFMATCLALSGGSYPAELPAHSGKSILPLLTGQDAPIHDEPLFWEHEGNAAVRWGNWKLVREYEHPWELYDLAADRSELHDLAEAEPQRRDEMVKLWEAWATRTGVMFPKRFNMYEHLNK